MPDETKPSFEGSEDTDQATGTPFPLAFIEPRNAVIKVLSISAEPVSPICRDNPEWRIFGADWLCADVKRGELTEWRWDCEKSYAVRVGDSKPLLHESLAGSLNECDLLAVIFTTNDLRQVELVKDIAGICHDQEVGFSIVVSQPASFEFDAGQEKTQLVEAPLLRQFDCYLQSSGFFAATQTVKVVVELITNSNMIGIDYADVIEVLGGSGQLFMGHGIASGEGRAVAAAESAINELPASFPANRILVCMSAGLVASLSEWSDATSVAEGRCHEGGILMSGWLIDEGLKESLAVTVLAGGASYIKSDNCCDTREDDGAGSSHLLSMEDIALFSFPFAKRQAD